MPLPPTPGAARGIPSTRAPPAGRSCRHTMRLKGRHENLLEALLVARARRVGVEREHVTPAIDDRELVDQPFELGNQMGGEEHGPAAGIAILVRADHGPDELAADDRIEPGGRLVEDEQFGLGQIAMTSASCVRWPFER